MSKYKKNKAAALKYNMEEDTAPVVIASGYGPMAEKIIDIAEQKGIPVFKDDSAASLLCMLDVGTNIPVELYEVVAAIYGKLMEASAKSRGNASPEKKRNSRRPENAPFLPSGRPGFCRKKRNDDRQHRK